MRKFVFTLFLVGMYAFQTFAQTVSIQGYVYETNNRGYLNLVKVTVMNAATGDIYGQAETNMEGIFELQLPAGREYKLLAVKDLFKPKETIFSTVGKKEGEKIFVRMEMERKPGYLFDVTLAEKRKAKDMPTDAIQGATIEVYNNTKSEEVLMLKEHPNPAFKVTFENGNHYTVLVRKAGFYNKRMEAFVNVKGCILCFEGVGKVEPGVSDVLTEGHTMGTLLANVEMDRIEVDKGIRLERIYYDKAKHDIRDDAAVELDKVVEMLKQNPSLLIELGSHTDSRGKSDYNQKLSQRRAQAAVDYLVMAGIDRSRLKAKGYGESKLVNSCGNGKECSESRHQRNRRTELKVTGYTQFDTNTSKSLVTILEEERFEKMLAEIQNGEEIKVGENGELPDEIKNQIAGRQEDKMESPSMEVPPSTNTPQPTAKVEETITQAAVPVKETVKEVAQTAVSTTKEKVKTETIPPTPSTTSKPTIADIESKKRRISKSEPVGQPAGMDAGGESLPNPKVKPSQSTTKPMGTGKIVGDQEVEVRQYIKKPNKIAEDFSGYLVEFFTAPYELPGSHEIFTRHGNIIMELTREGTYSYLLGEFESWRDANKFLNSIMLSRYPEARVIRYKRGERLRG